jgi:ankyrin repeat protein
MAPGAHLLIVAACFASVVPSWTASISGSNISLKHVTDDDHTSVDWDAAKLDAAGLDTRMRGTDSLTPLRAAAKYNAVKLVTELLSRGANVTLGHPRTGETATMIAARNGSVEALEVLLKEGANARALARATDIDGRSAVHLAALRPTVGAGARIVRLLAAAGADVGAIDSKGHSALHIACYFGGDPSMVEALLELGADPNPIDPKGNAPLHFCASKGKLEEATMLVKAGADALLKNSMGETALIRAEAAGKRKDGRALQERNARAIAKMLRGEDGEL